MIVKAENPIKIQINENLMKIAMDIVIYADDGTTELHREGISAIANTRDNKKDTNGTEKWEKHLIKRLIKEKEKIIKKFNSLNKSLIDSTGAKSQIDALDIIAKKVERGKLNKE